MKTITIDGKEFRPYITIKQLEENIQHIAETFNARYEGSTEENCPIFIVVLNGAARFANKLFEYLTFRYKIEYCKYHSYTGTESTELVADLPMPHIPAGHDVMLIEDLIDTGRTTLALVSEILDLYPHMYGENLGVITLLNKPNKHTSLTDYFIQNRDECINIDNEFIVGYGMDYNGYGRELNEIYIEV